MNSDPTDAGVTALLERATRGLQPDVARLVAQGTARGRRTRRRHLVATTVSTLVLAGAAVVMPSLGSGGGAASDRTTVAADPGSDRREVAVSPADLARTLSTLLPGKAPRTDLWVESGSDGAHRGTLTWRGARVTVAIDDAPDVIVDDPGATYGDGSSAEPRPAPATAGDWCRAMGNRCRELPGGDWASSSRGFDGDPADPAGWQASFVLYTRDGYLVLAQASSLDDGAPGRARFPVLSVRELRGIATSGVWFGRS
jgi:hypothetical protein